MKSYSVFLKKNKSEKITDVILLREGFSWPAFCFSNLWFLYQKMWREFLALSLINLIFAILLSTLSSFDKIFLEISLVFVVAINGNYWLAEHLKRKGYEFSGIVFGEDMIVAKIRFLKGLTSERGDKSPEFGDSILRPQC